MRNLIKNKWILGSAIAVIILIIAIAIGIAVFNTNNETEYVAYTPEVEIEEYEYEEEYSEEYEEEGLYEYVENVGYIAVADIYVNGEGRRTFTNPVTQEVIQLPPTPNRIVDSNRNEVATNNITVTTQPPANRPPAQQQPNNPPVNNPPANQPPQQQPQQPPVNNPPTQQQPNNPPVNNPPVNNNPPIQTPPPPPVSEWRTNTAEANRMRNAIANHVAGRNQNVVVSNHALTGHMTMTAFNPTAWFGSIDNMREAEGLEWTVYARDWVVNGVVQHTEFRARWR